MNGYFANLIDALPSDALAGFAEAHRDLVAYDVEHGYLRAVRPSGRRLAGLVSGGGSGHEPLHIGFVGAGMLDAACPGRIFTSPHNRQIYEASRAVAGPDGVLHLVKNYTGDRINFGIAAERLAHQGIRSARVLIDDDVASDSVTVAAGRRGTGGTVLVEKMLGAAADAERGLDELAKLGSELVRRCRSLSVAAAPHTAPSTGLPAFELASGTLEFGVGIHGERAERTCAHRPVAELVEEMTAELLGALEARPGMSMIVLVNGLGAVTRLELYGIFRELERALRHRRITVARKLVGDYVTALDMRGFSLTLFVADEESLALWDAPAHTQAWQGELTMTGGE